MVTLDHFQDSLQLVNLYLMTWLYLERVRLATPVRSMVVVSSLMTQITSELESVHCTSPDPSIKVHHIPFITSWVMLLTNRQTLYLPWQWVHSNYWFNLESVHPSVHQAPFMAGWTEAQWNKKFAQHFYTWSTLETEPLHDLLIWPNPVDQLLPHCVSLLMINN